MEFGELIDEAFEQAGLDPASITHRHIKSLTRSLDLLYTEIEDEGVEPEYRTETQVFPLAVGQGGIILPDDTIDLVNVSFRSSGAGISNDGPMTRMNRTDYMGYVQKNITTRPSHYWVSKSKELEFVGGALKMAWGDSGPMVRHWNGDVGSAADVTKDQRILILWPGNGLAGASAVVTRIRWSKLVGGILEDIDGSRAWLDTICAGLAARTAEKWNKPEYDRLQAKFESKLARRVQNEDMAPLKISFRGPGLPRWRRR